MALPALATPNLLQPPVTGTMYNGNNLAAPKLEAASTTSNHTISRGAGDNNMPDSSSSAANDAQVRTPGNASNNAATGNTAGSGANGSMNRAGGGN
jgi:hypothetical protein